MPCMHTYALQLQPELILSTYLGNLKLYVPNGSECKPRAEIR